VRERHRGQDRAILYVLTLLVFFAISVACIGLYAIDRTRHEANLATPAAVRDAEA
jgi:hypothetical protein